MKVRTKEVIEGFSQNIYEFGEGNPKIMITSGVHGDEVTAIYVIENLIKYLQSKEIIKGSIKIVSNSNPFAVNDISRKAHIDNVDMNRIFPGNPQGSEAFKAANSLWEESKDMETIIDVHCCSQNSMPYILAIYNEKPELLH